MTNEQFKVTRQLDLLIREAKALYSDLKNTEPSENAIMSCGNFVQFTHRVICHAIESIEEDA